MTDGRQEFDEIVGKGVEFIHLEKMNAHEFWLSIETKTERVMFFLGAKRAPVDGWEYSREPINGYSVGQRRRWAKLTSEQRKRRKK